MLLDAFAPYDLRRSDTERITGSGMQNPSTGHRRRTACSAMSVRPKKKSQAGAWLSVAPAADGVCPCLLGAGVFHRLGSFGAIHQFDKGHRRIVALTEAHLQN